jgi:6-phosphogluconolactonase
MQIHTSDTKNDLVIAFADWLVHEIGKVLSAETLCSIALSGGSTPMDLFKLLASEDYKNKIDWSKIHIFWGDERDVPYADERNNARAAFEALLNHVPVPTSQIHVMDTSVNPMESAAKYEQMLHQYFDGKPNSFDIVMLGMGDDGHTLSLFPGTEVVNENEKWVTAFYLKAQGMNRITLTAPIVNQAKAICFLVVGKIKAPALKEVLQGEYNPMLYPSQRIQPSNGQLHWFIDKAAAELL